MELEITRPYKNVCGFGSRLIPVYGLIKDLKVSLAANKDISVLMDLLVKEMERLSGWPITNGSIICHYSRALCNHLYSL